MTPAEGLVLVHVIMSIDPFASQRDPEDLRNAAKVFASMLPNTPISWAQPWLREELTRGRVPSLPEMASAWKTEAHRRVAAVPVPTAPAEIEDDPVRWQQWERQRREALVEGASEAEAIGRADRELGVSQQRAQIASGHSAEQVRSAKEDVRAQLREWEERQRRHQHDAENNNRGGEAR